MRARQATTAVEFAICALAMVLIIVGFIEFGRLVWTFEVLQEVASEGARCMGLRASSCAKTGAYNAASTTTYLVGLATSRGVVITSGMISLSNTATCGGTGGVSQGSINYAACLEVTYSHATLETRNPDTTSVFSQQLTSY